ncbi:LutC/YkgG family protein [Corynebacterium renale]|uniref:L-lactate dehydrogenase complex protein LldG n=1 Tax=Corynebacterium renale TaxID=1724 RepID=A0A2A9DK62_9CORY|nr:LUD domain-containing protein [Corynebacterium renale]PFG27088.1 L-lactate dehydrogenase complex protein LldG [Corynebacterium renale]SQI24187.1 Uncharacterised ACR, YkgG family COG1556 [Corynebacterium renale]
MSAKAEILSRIRNAEKLAGVPAEPREIPRNYKRSSDMSRDDLRELLIDRLVDYKADVVRTTTDEVPAKLAEVLADRGAKTVVYAPGLDSELLSDADVTATADDVKSDPRALNSVDAVLTASTVSCAQTGTICLQAGAKDGRRALTLVPDRHIVLVHMDTVVYGIPETVSRLSPDTPITWISGPSATSDIELERVEGVHGPRDLIVFVID